MDCNLQRLAPWWLIFFYSACTFTESQLLHSVTNSWGRTYGNTRPQFTAVTQKQSTEHGERPRPVVVKCHPDSMEVVVQADMFDTGHRVDGRHLRLGSNSVGEESECRAAPSGEAEFTIQAQLMSCGTKLSSTKDKIIYSNVLVYSPESSSEGLLRLDGATIPVECHYKKKYSVDGISLRSNWVPFVSTASAEDQIDFNLLLMTDDWKFQRGSSTYFLGDPINFEVSAVIGNHMPLRVYIDHCVGTATPDADATLRYNFIEHHGCLADAYLTNSSSHFLPRTEEHKLRFQLDAFIFYQAPSNQVYVTCYVKAVPATMAVNSLNRACSLTENRWRSVDGNDEACRSCDIAHQFEEALSIKPPKTMSTKPWPAISSQEGSFQSRPEHLLASYIHFRPGLHQHRDTKIKQSSDKLIKRGTDYKGQEIQLGPLHVLPFSKFITQPTDFKIIFSPKNKTTKNWGYLTGA